MEKLVSVIIPTYNRFDSCINAIKSVQNQTYKNFEIIVVNDSSPEDKYYKYNWPDIKIIHLLENSREKFGYPCAGYVRNIGVQVSKGEFIAFLDDDDYWFPEKLEKQLEVIDNFCVTEAYCGKGTYDEHNKYRLMLQDYHYEFLKNKYKNNHFDISKGFPKKWGERFLDIHNCCITSSAMVRKSLIEKVGYMDEVRNGKEDYSYWKRLIRETKCNFIAEPMLYYDMGHGKGRNY